MSKLFDALKRAEQERASHQGNSGAKMTDSVHLVKRTLEEECRLAEDAIMMRNNGMPQGRVPAAPAKAK